MEIGIDAPDFPFALRSAVRQAPDVIVVGEMRDPETMRIALSAAETGHLVFATVHTTDVSAAVSRIADAFPTERQNAVRQELSMALAAILTQTLVPAKTGGVVPVAELLMVSYGARQHMRKNALQHLNQEITITRKAGSFSFEESLARLREKRHARTRRRPASGGTSGRARIAALARTGSSLMQIGFIGLGRMGGNMTRRLAEAGHTVVAWDRSSDAVRRAAPGGHRRPPRRWTISSQRSRRPAPSGSWFLPARRPRRPSARSRRLLSAGDVVIDGGNTHFKDDVRRAQILAAKGIDYVDVGTSGGVWGAERGYCLMIGGGPDCRGASDTTVRGAGSEARRVFALAARQGRRAGHFVKMIHNGIEYGLMQSYAEGFDILRNADSPALAAEHRYTLDLAAIAEVWRHGSVVSSWLLDLVALALRKDPQLEGFTGTVGDSGEGRWTVAAAIEEDVPADVLTTALFTRFRSRRDHTFAEKLLSALRAQFGGHAEPR